MTENSSLSPNLPAPGLVSLVTGGGRGLGLAFVHALLAAGGSVATFSRGETDAVRKLAEDAATRDRFHFECLDSRDTPGVQRFVQHVAKRFGRVDVLVNNAGIARDGIHAVFNDDDIDDVLDINLRATLKITKTVIRQMLAQSLPAGDATDACRGRVINISSIIGQRGYRGLATYSATKAALDGATRALARELGDRGILVNSIAPGYLRTEMSHGLDEAQLGQIERRTPLRRLGTADDISPLLLFLCSPGARFITGQTFTIDGGLTV